MEYKNFRVRIEAAPSGGFRISGQSDFGEDTETFRVPFPRRRIESLPLLFERLRKAQQEEQELRPTAEEIGDELFRSVFSGKVGELFQKTRVRLEAQGRGHGLRIQLDFDLNDSSLVPFAALPWELLRDGSGGGFLSLIPRTPLVRYVSMSWSAVNNFEGPLKILVVQSSPKEEGLNPIDFKTQWKAIWENLDPQPDIRVDSVLHPSLNGLQRKLLEDTWHVLHFVGHGGLDPETGQGRLYFESATGRRPEPVTGTLLGQHLMSCPDLRLVFLNACRSGMIRRNRQHPFNSVAMSLLQAGIPAVIGAQAPISNEAAATFSAAFYDRLAARDPVDAAMVQGRLAVLRTLPFDWGNPVLFTSVADCDILRPASTGSAPVTGCPYCAGRSSTPLRLGIRTFSETPGRVLWGKEMDDECDDILDLRSFFTGEGGRYPKTPSIWEEEVVPQLRDFLREATAARRPIHLNFASHASTAFAAGYFLEAKSGLEITIRQRGQAGFSEWRALAGRDRKGPLFLHEKDLPGTEDARDVALALSITKPVLPDVEEYLRNARLAVHRVLPATLAPAPSQLGVQDGLHAFRLAEAITQKVRQRPSSESGGTVHLFGAAPNALLFFLGQLWQGLGPVQLYEQDFFSDRLGDYSPSILLPPAEGGPETI